MNSTLHACSTILELEISVILNTKSGIRRPDRPPIASNPVFRLVSNKTHEAVSQNIQFVYISLHRFTSLLVFLVDIDMLKFLILLCS